MYLVILLLELEQNNMTDESAVHDENFLHYALLPCINMPSHWSLHVESAGVGLLRNWGSNAGGGGAASVVAAHTKLCFRSLPFG